MIGAAKPLKSRVSHVGEARIEALRDCPWYIHTPQGDHMWAEDWESAMGIANRHAREAQIEALR